MTDKNGYVSLNRIYLILIVIAAIGAPFASFATFNGRLAATEKVANKCDSKISEFDTRLRQQEITMMEIKTIVNRIDKKLGN